MPRMSVSDIVGAARALFRQYSATNTNWTDTDKALHIMPWLNTAYRNLFSLKKWPWLQREYEFSTTSTTSAGSSTGATLGVTSIAGFYVGESIYITDGSTAERVEITAIGLGTFTVSPDMEETWAADSTVGKIDYWFPSDVVQIERLQRVGDYAPIVFNGEDDWNDTYSWQTAKGQPTDYSLHENWNITEDLTSTTSTTTTSVIASTTPLQISNDDYNGWILEGRATDVVGSAIVSDFTASTKTFALDRVLTGMTTGKAFRLKMNRPKLRIAPIPDAAYRLEVHYLARPAELINYYDFPEYGGDSEDYGMVLAYLLAEKMARSLPGDNTAFIQLLHEDGLKEMSSMVGSLIQKPRAAGGSVIRVA